MLVRRLEMRHRNATRETFLILEHFSTQVLKYQRKLIPLSHCPENALLHGVDGLYDHEKDSALLCLRFSPDVLTEGKRVRFIYLASAAGIQVLDPQRLSGDDRTQFYQKFLRRYSVRLTDFRSPSEAVEALVKLIGHGESVPIARGTQSIKRTTKRTTIVPTMTMTPKDTNDDSLIVRFKRGDSWMPARLRNLGIKDARLAASSGLPLGASTQVTITISDYGVSLKCKVVEVINTERSVDGSTSFRVEFDYSARERTQLVELLKVAKRVGISLKTPPARKNRRFAVTWPMAVQAKGDRLDAAALDISEQGFFLGTSKVIVAPKLRFGIVLDRPDLVVHGEAAVVRSVTEQMARTRGLSRGYGLYIASLQSEHTHRFKEFLSRIQQRSQRHIVVAGESERSRLLAEYFESAGYAVSKSATADSLRTEQTDNLGADIAVVDYSAMKSAQGESFESAFRDKRVKTLKLQGQGLQVARDALDRMLSV